MSHVTPSDTSRPSRVRRLLVAGVVTLGLLALAPVAPASAGEPTAAQWAAMGRTSAPAYRLAEGCQRYRYSYRISPPEPEWTLEILITDAAGVGQASDVMASGADGTSGTRTFQLCGNNVAPGTFTIRSRLTYRHYASMPIGDETRDYSGWLTPSHFRAVHRTSGHVSKRCAKARKKARRLDTAKARRAARRVCRRS